MNRKGQLCEVLVRGKMNSCLVRFLDGFKAVTSRNALRRSLVILFLLLAPVANAGPKHWAKTHKRFLFMEGAAFTAASIHAAGLHHCRKVNGVEPCDEHYGAAWAGFGIATGFNTIVWPALAEHCWANGDNKLCYAIGYTGSAVQLGHGIYEWQLYKPEKDLTIQRVMSLDYKKPR